jgi:Ulp1 family protease
MHNFDRIDNDNFFTLNANNNYVDNISISLARSESSLDNLVKPISSYASPSSSPTVTNLQLNADNNSTAVNKFGIVITYKDLFSTCNANWFNDNIIDFYFHLISSFFGDSSVYSLSHYIFTSYASSLQLNLKKTTLEKISKHKFLLIPTLFNKHWRVLIINILKKEICLYDSLNLFEIDYTNLILGLLSSVLVVEKSSLTSTWSFKKVYKPSQFNDFDCGAFICLYVRYFFLNASSSFSENQIPDFRIHIQKEILGAELQTFDSLDTGFDKAES